MFLARDLVSNKKALYLYGTYLQVKDTYPQPKDRLYIRRK